MAQAKLKYLLDTHALIWAAVENDRLGPAAVRAIMTTPHEALAISDVSLQEIGLLIHLGKLRCKVRPEKVLSQMLEHLRVVPISLEIALRAPELPLPHGDQFDRIITATALVLNVPLITRDANITDAGLVPTLW